MSIGTVIVPFVRKDFGVGVGIAPGEAAQAARAKVASITDAMAAALALKVPIKLILTHAARNVQHPIGCRRPIESISMTDDDDRRSRRLEERHPRSDRTKEATVRDVLGISWVRYRQRLLQIVQRRDVLEEYAVLAHRVIRMTDAGVRARASRSFAA
jgi:hypothetical protein